MKGTVSCTCPGVQIGMDDQTQNDTPGSHPKQSDAQAPGNTQVTNPNKEIGDGEEIVEDSKD